MGLVWIVTTGNSDVKLLTDKGYSALKDNEIKRKLLGSWYTKDLLAKVNKVNKDDWTLHARFTGIIYGDAIATHFHVLKFPLLDGFCNQLVKSDKKPDRIIILLTDQENIFEMGDRSDIDCPYWKDTCTLEPILSHYLRQKYKDILIEPIFLQPKSDSKGLDDWDVTLKLVQTEFDKLGITQDDEVIVSHQAGTPAISSAVQFVGLSMFGSKVNFLLSNERTHEVTLSNKYSSYLRSMQIRDAENLLSRYDYSGVKALIYSCLDDEGKTLLDAAIQWNLAEFDKFRDNLPSFYKENLDLWWSAGYESAYLAVIRYYQENIVEALFHSFRAIEGLICKWAENKYTKHILNDKNGSPQIKESIKTVLPNYWEKIQEKNESWLKQQEKDNENRLKKGKDIKEYSVGLFSQNLYILLEDIRPDCKENEYMKKGLYSAKDARNQQFHRLLALQEEDLIKAWKVSSISEWQNAILGCLNFIAKDDLTKEFKSLKEASLMSQIHQELEEKIKAIASYPH